MTSSNGNIFPRNWPFVQGIHRSPVNSPRKGQWHGALMFSLICVWINDWVNNREAGDLRRYPTHYDVIVMCWRYIWCPKLSWTGDHVELIARLIILIPMLFFVTLTEEMGKKIKPRICMDAITYLYTAFNGGLAKSPLKWRHGLIIAFWNFNLNSVIKRDPMSSSNCGIHSFFARLDHCLINLYL